MKRLLFSYLLWVLLPIGVTLALSRSFLPLAHKNQFLESGERFARLGALFLQDQMSAMATELGKEAPVLSQPDSSSPIIRAALRGDTVAALGTFSGELVLSFALAESQEEGSGLQIRGVTRPFPSQFLIRLHRAVGYDAAFYLRGDRVAEAPDGFGPETLPSPGPGASGTDPSLVDTGRGSGVLFPLSENRSSSSALHLLVAPSLPLPPRPSPWRSTLPLLAGAGLGLLFLVRTGGGTGSQPARSSRILLFLAFLLPVGGLWLSLVGNVTWLEEKDLEFRRGELVRAVAVLNPGGEGLRGEALTEATGFGVTRISEGEVVFSSAEGPLQEVLTHLPLPRSSLPTPGVIDGPGPGTLYASSWETSEQLLILTDSTQNEPPPGIWLHLAFLGGVASLLGMIFLWRARQFISPSSSGPGR